MSSPNPHRRATLFSIRSIKPGTLFRSRSQIAVAIKPGQMEFTVFPISPISSERSCHRIDCTLRTCICDATKGPRKLATDEMLTIDPGPDASLVRQAQYSASAKRTLIEKTRSKSSSESASGLLRIGIPALLTIMSTPSPCVASRTCSACRDAPRGERSAKIFGSFLTRSRRGQDHQ